MNSRLCAPLLTLSLLAPALTAPRGDHAAIRDGMELRARCDAGLAELRAGHVSAPQTLDASERALLHASQPAGDDLANLRAGSPSDEELGWIAIGALIVVILLLI